jgi:hypothetical protein
VGEKTGEEEDTKLIIVGRTEVKELLYLQEKGGRKEGGRVR